MVTGQAYARDEARGFWDLWLAAHDREVREQCAQEIEAEAQNYAGDASRDFATIYARIIREGGRDE